MDIIKPKNDTRNYKFYTLKNNIKCILINDKDLDKSYVFTSVNTGSFANKEYYDGMAHLLEHMCFITSKKYKEKDYLAHKISEAGGFINAFTAELNTVYYLDLFTKNLEEILEIFIDFLTNAELKEEYILSELENVDSEHMKNITNDNWKLFNLERQLSNQNSNYNSFYTGSKETLNKKDIYNKMLDFYKKYYNSNNISVCIASNKSIKELYDIVNKYYGNIEKSNTTDKLNLIKPIYSNNKGKTFIMQANGDTKILKYIFEIDSFDINSKIYQLLIDILNSNEKNSCYDILISNGLINNLYSEFDNHGIFSIQIILTNKGYDNINLVNYLIEISIKQILDFDWNKILKYNKKKYLFLFNNINKIDIHDLCTHFLMNLIFYPPQLVYFNKYNYDNINDSKYLKKYINFDNCIRIITTNKFNYKNYMIDKYYNTKYVELNKNYYTNNIKINIKYDTNNKYSNLKPKYIENIKNNYPIEISKNIWYGGTSLFKETNVYCKILFGNNTYFSTPLNYLLTNISILILNYYLNKELYKASEYNFNIGFSTISQYNLIILNLNFYNDYDYIQEFINDIFNLLNKNIDISDDIILSNIYELKNNLLLIKTYNSWDFCNYIFNNSYYNSYMFNELLKIIDTISINQIKLYCKNILNNSSAKIFIFGNIKKNQIPNFNVIKDKLNNKTVKKSKLKIFKEIKYKNPNIKEKSKCIKISYFVGKFDPIKNLHLLFIKFIFIHKFFEELRTTKKLGYLVEMFTSSINEEYYIYQQIQSEKDIQILLIHINKFNNTLIDIIKKINLNKWKETIIDHLNKKENNTNELFNKYYNEIISETYLFNRNYLMLKYINFINKESLIKFIKKFIINNNKINIIKIN